MRIKVVNRKVTRQVEDIDVRYQCTECGHEFSDFKTLLGHMSEAHGWEPPYKEGDILLSRSATGFLWGCCDDMELVTVGEEIIDGGCGEPLFQIHSRTANYVDMDLSEAELDEKYIKVGTDEDSDKLVSELFELAVSQKVDPWLEMDHLYVRASFNNKHMLSLLRAKKLAEEAKEVEHGRR